ncbi:hypothetical protein [Micromonospora sp. NBC_01813]|uniref:hypothetical protein n=1 Tax=Micromonospora sp. NBC_01813 TaxID=2975988 RepID=UPI002DD96A9C|nr:hypothetical protein [Micromonospora sp. NBC_01813]WSA11886.1 hypothetical protein OG958_14525 [Micromonospora sp. NBC_01813]
MIYTTSGVGSVRRWIRGWPAATAVAVVALSGLLLLALVACGAGTGRLSGPSDADEVTGSAGLGGAPATTETSGTGPADGGHTGSGGNGGGDSGNDGAEPEPEVTPAAEDCVGYDPANLSVTQQGDAWLMRDGNHAIKLFATSLDAQDGVKVARNWTQICYIGRGNERADRRRYIVTYFQGPSGLPLGLAPSFDCTAYDPAELAVHEPDGDGWSLRAGQTSLLVLDDAADAERARLVAAGNTRLCLIGRDNDEPDPARYQLEYWRQ